MLSATAKQKQAGIPVHIPLEDAGCPDPAGDKRAEEAAFAPDGYGKQAKPGRG